MAGPFPTAVALQTPRLVLEPLQVQHAAEMATLLSDAALYRFTGGGPLDEPTLRARYTRQVAGRSPDGRQAWRNWIVRRASDGAALGFVQATVSDADGEPRVAELAWTIGVAFQRHGYAREAAVALRDWLSAQGVAGLIAHIHPENTGSMGVARALGLSQTAVVRGGEVLWASPPVTSSG